MNQTGRNLTDAVDGLLNCKRYLIQDRDPVLCPMPEDKPAASSVVVRSVLPFETCCGIGRKRQGSQ
jgi:hypothetical protein